MASAASNNSTASAGLIGASPLRLMRARSRLLKCAVMPPGCSHKPHASDIPANPAACR
ncbi:Uncharacterised protein [Mycobacterium tuberculosis]|uniref:Uncharacterized protein n=1 Tax=Mycobacterium tuberculosis TaxID=1773 RepID=A0A655IVK9_MYCTX|nr:Uncharacterised protein [Mycobacterium tuberculosis]COW21347.1 Uncharacterised protein [Mycobacterium tuberculosis]COW37983.1 Uncharacterised protein [Mycobacterium tuberculosis]